MSDDPRKRVVVLGAGFAGLRCTLELSSTYQVTWVDPKDAIFEFVPHSVHSLVHPDAAGGSLATLQRDPSAPYTFVQGLATAIKTDGVAGEVTLKGGSLLPFDYCLIATGSSYKGACHPPERPPAAQLPGQSSPAPAALSTAAPNPPTRPPMRTPARRPPPRPHRGAQS
jgi:hypothetical protein